jgi:signal transduction histidine kinase
MNTEDVICVESPECGRTEREDAAPATADPGAVAAVAGGEPVGFGDNNRILVVDDNPAIHEDFRKVLCDRHEPSQKLLDAEALIFGSREPANTAPRFDLTSARQGQEALECVRRAVAGGRPFALAFVDVRMPPGWDGVETIARLWEVDPNLQVVICTAYSDYSWEEMVARLGGSESLLILKKPFDSVEVLQMASALTRKWELQRQAAVKMAELAQMVARRTCDLQESNLQLQREVRGRVESERQLRHAQKMEAIGQLAAGIAHDFNNILTVVHGHASMLLMRLGAEGPHAKSALEIRQCAERAANLVRQLLMFSRKQIMQFRNVDVGEIIQSVSGMVRQLVGEHIAVELCCAPGLPAVHGDRGSIEQIIVNLTVNSRDALPRGGQITLKASVIDVDAARAARHPEARPGQFVCLEVSDTGCGMDEQAMNHLFEPFFTTKDAGKGTGLGLATVYGIVKQHKGWIEVRSAVGQGTTVQVHFPVSSQVDATREDATSDTPGRRGTETILIAEDEAPLRDMVSEVLRLHGYHVLTAGSGPAALEIWRRERSRIDLLLTDMVMPGGMMGSELAAEIRAANPRLKVLYTSGYSPGINANPAALQPEVNFLPKPYSPTQLVRIVRKCLDAGADTGSA